MARPVRGAFADMPARSKLQGKNETETVLDILEKLTSNPPSGLAQKISVDCDDLRDVSH
jgi:hypothetical protein